MTKINTSDDEVCRVATLFGALSSTTRLRILRLLKQQSLCVGALAVRLDLSQGAISQHLRVLKQSGLVQDERRGYYVHYRLSPMALSICVQALEDLRVGRQSSQGGPTCVTKGSARNPKS